MDERLTKDDLEAIAKEIEQLEKVKMPEYEGYSGHLVPVINRLIAIIKQLSAEVEFLMPKNQFSDADFPVVP
jgi:hypothetical protein